MCAVFGAVSAPYLARDYHRPNGLLCTVVCCIQAGAVEKREDGIAFPQQVVGQAPIGSRALVAFQSAVQAIFQLLAGDRQLMFANLV